VIGRNLQIVKSSSHRRRCGPIARLAALLALTCTACLAWQSTALGAGSPQWTVTAVSKPTNFVPGAPSGADSYSIAVINTGSAPSDGSPITVSDELPSALSLDAAGASGEEILSAVHGKRATMTCLLTTCTYTGVVVPEDRLIVTFPVDVAPQAPPLVSNFVQVSGGGAASATRETATKISAQPAEFGIAPGGSATALSTEQAGAHADLTTTIAFNTVNGGSLAGTPKDTTDDLPPGFAGDLIDTPSCPPAKFLQEACPVASQVGIVDLTLAPTGVLKGDQLEPLYNIAPNPGEVAKLGFELGDQFFYEGDVSVRAGDYGLRTTFFNASEGAVELQAVTLTVWGVPAEPVHDPWRSVNEVVARFGASSDAAAAPYLSNPTLCQTEPLHATFTVNSWEHPDSTVTQAMPFAPMFACDRLGMEPALDVEPTSADVSSPTGLALTMKVPQTYDNATGLATSTLKRAAITLPEGMTVNPSAGAGLGACTPTEYAEEGVQSAVGVGCPSSSKLGTVKIKTPSLTEEGTGSVFLAQPYDNPFGSLLTLYIVARFPERAILVKAAGEVSPNPVTGRLVTTFDDLPPLPFTTFEFDFRQGATSPLVTPPTCGSYQVLAALTPWANPERSPLTPFIPPFSISGGVGGGACPQGLPPFSPQVTAGTSSNRAASYSPMDIRITRDDGEQEITGFSTQLPPGLTASLTHVPFCPDAAIESARSASRTGAREEAEPSCPAASEIGQTQVGAGVGGQLVWAPGKVYMAGPYHGAPFSIVAITSAKVGPFDLGTVVVRDALSIDPTTAVVRVVAGASDPIPHIIKGIVVHVRDIRVYVNRPNFIINPTNCERLTFTAAVTGAGANFENPADDSVSSAHDAFQASECSSLHFKPIFKASVTGKNSKAAGAALHVTIAYPNAAQGTQANIHKVRVELPIQLPSRLTTLQKACLASVFNANPSACPAASVVGHATAITPVLPVPLSGPAYFVSNGNARFPELVLVLQGYGITIDLHGETFIDKHGVTSSTFHEVPDQPVTSFELTLPQGPYSALTANKSLCDMTKVVTVRKRVTVRRQGRITRRLRTVKQHVAQPLLMPTEIVAQNGAEIHQKTKMTVTGCAKARSAKPKHKKRKRTRRTA
jgi:hypothetical protein